MTCFNHLANCNYYKNERISYGKLLPFIGPPVRFKRALQDAEVRERDVAVLECEVPEESISTAWYLEDQRLQPGNKYNMEQKGTRRRLTIQNVGTDDDGVYLCEMPDGGKTIAELAVKGKVQRDSY